MKKILLSISFFAYTAYAICQNSMSNCGHVLPQIETNIETISLCNEVITDLPILSASSDLPQTAYFILDTEQLADDGIEFAIRNVDDDGQFIPADLGMTYHQNFAICPFAYDLGEFRDMIAHLLEVSDSGVSCCNYVEQTSGDFCNLLNEQGIYNAADVTGLEDVFNILKAANNDNTTFYSVGKFVEEINALQTKLYFLSEACYPNTNLCYAIGENDQQFYIAESPQILEVNVDIPDQITILTTMETADLEYSIHPDFGWQSSNIIGNIPSNGRAYVREVNTLCADNKAFSIVNLNVELGSFGGTAEATTNLISWTTETEIKSDKFIVERSSDGQNFSTVGEVQAQGDSNEPVAYEFYDLIPLTGNSYYRLAMIDIYGNVDYSSTISVQREDINGFSILSIGPNPSANLIRVSITNNEPDEVDYIIYDLMGKKVKSGSNMLNTGINTFMIDATVMGTGMYIFTAVKGDYVVSAYKFVMH